MAQADTLNGLTGLDTPWGDLDESWVNLADAVRITGRHIGTVKRWLTHSARAWTRLGIPNALELDARGDLRQELTADELAEAMQRWEPVAQRRGDLFAPSEARRLDVIRGASRAYALQLEALHRVHLAHGGVYWQPEGRNANARYNPQLAGEITGLRERIAALEAENARLRIRSAPYVPALGGQFARSAAPVALDVRADERRASGDTPPARPEGLPEGWELVAHVAAAHGIERARSSTWRENGAIVRAIKQGDWRQQTARGGSVAARNALDPDGQDVFGYALGRATIFRFCGQPACIVCDGARRRLGEEAARLATQQTFAGVAATGAAPTTGLVEADTGEYGT